MFASISTGFALARSSWAVLVRDKHLLVFPFVSGILFLMVMASFAVPLAVLVDWNQFDRQLHANNNKPPLWTYAVAFAFYFCTYFVATFCNAALVGCALLRFNGQTPTVGDGFRTAMARLPQIFAWALVSATVGMLLKAVENVHEKAGEFIASLLGMAWSALTFFVVPILVVEKVGPIQAVSRSISILKNTWGEALVGRGGIGFVLFLVAIPLFLMGALGIYLLAMHMTVLGIAVLVVTGICFMIYAAVSSAMNTILMAAIYQYAVGDHVPEAFDRDGFAGAFARG